MKKIIAFIALLIVLASCGTTKKLQTTHTSFADSTATSSSAAQKVEKIIDTTRTDNKKITITEIEFYPPSVDDEPKFGMDTTTKDNDTSTVKETHDKPKDEPKGKPARNADVAVLNFGNVKGTVKSIKQTVIESNVEERGESKESSESEEAENATSMTQAELKEEIDETPTADPKRWRYIFYIMMLLVAVAAFLYIKRAPIVEWLKKILSGIRKVF